MRLVLGILCYVRDDGSIDLSDKMIQSLSTQSDMDYDVVLAINNSNNYNLTKEIPNLYEVIHLTTNDIGLARNKLMGFFSHMLGSNYLMLLDGNDELLPTAVEIIKHSIDKGKPNLDEILAFNFLTAWSMTKMTPVISSRNIHRNRIRIPYTFLWYLISTEQALELDENAFFEGDVSKDDLWLTLKLLMLGYKFKFVMTPIQIHDMTGSVHVGSMDSKFENLASWYLSNPSLPIIDVIY